MGIILTRLVCGITAAGVHLILFIVLPNAADLAQVEASSVEISMEFVDPLDSVLKPPAAVVKALPTVVRQSPTELAPKRPRSKPRRHKRNAVIENRDKSESETLPVAKPSSHSVPKEADQIVPKEADEPAGTEQDSPDAPDSKDGGDTTDSPKSGAISPSPSTDKKTKGAQTPGLSSSARLSLRKKYTRELAVWLARNKRYPRLARSRRQQGTVLLAFKISRKGLVLGYKIKKSSGHTLLDTEVVAILKRAQPLPPIPPALGANSLNVLVPVNFKIR